MQSILKGPEVTPTLGTKPKNIVIMLHGVGADGDNLISLADFLSDEFPDTYFVAPNGPEKFAMGGPGYQWFPYYERSHEQIIEGVQKAAELVSEYAQQLLDKFDLKPENLIIMGFSQGAMTAIQTGLTMQDNCAGVLAFSGGLIKVDITNFEVRSNPPICLIHGTVDDVVPVQMSEVTSSILESFNVPVELHKIIGLGHSIDMEGVNIAKGFLSKVLKS